MNKWITIQPTDEKYCNECTYLIGINSRQENVKYQIIVEQPSDTGFIEKTLVFGIPTEDEVYDKKVKWYSIVLDGQKDFNIYTGVSGGNIKVDLYYDQESKDKPKQSVLGGESIKIRNLTSKMQNVYIKVTGLQYTFYSILVSEIGKPIYLSEGMPMIVEAAEKVGDDVEFLCEIPSNLENVPLRLSVTQLNNEFSLKVYTSLSGNNQTE